MRGIGTQVATVEIFKSPHAVEGVSISMAAFWLGSTGAYRLFNKLQAELPNSGAIWIHAGTSLVECICMLFLASVSPETAKRPLDTHLYGWISNTTRPSSEREQRRGRGRCSALPPV